MSKSEASGSLAQGFRVQARVLGALILRELHTRFGRENIGFLWFIVEPLILALGITLVHGFLRRPLPEGLETVPFYISGYIPFMMFRSNVVRAATTVLSNRVLLYHRHVKLIDLLLSRTILELIATLVVLLLLLYAAAWVGLGPVPARPLYLFGGMFMMFWFTSSLAMLVCAIVEYFPAVADRLVPPAVYLTLPLSGMFFRIAWLPPQVREWAVWLPLPQMLDMVRLGVFEQLTPEYIRFFYLIAVCGVMTLLGLLSLNLVRRRIRFA